MLARDAQGDPSCDPPPIRMCLHAMDVWVRHASILTDRAAVTAALRTGARAGGATVVEEAFHVFPNGAVTGVLVLAQSHLSIHTWPELALANVDLLSYGDVDGDRVMRVIGDHLGAERAHVTCVPRSSG
ncbi:MAG TPA: adenosylmethionine decarboxylase [Gaiellaceae bacterium]|nr:adenosylmethionine decarboxylase [Gaiellaceae bacterium]